MAPQKIKTADGHIMTIDGDMMSRLSAVFKDMASHLDAVEVLGEEGDHVDPIVFGNISKDMWDLILLWATQHRNDTEADNVDFEKVPRAERAEKMSPWDKQFIGQMTKETISELLHGASFLQIEKLEDLCCQQTVLNLRGKSLDEMRQYLGIKNDLTEEEIARIKLENEWLKGTMKAGDEEDDDEESAMDDEA